MGVVQINGSFSSYLELFCSFTFQTFVISSPIGSETDVMTKSYTPMVRGTMMNGGGSVRQIVSHNSLNGTAVDSQQPLMEVPAKVNKLISDR